MARERRNDWLDSLSDGPRERLKANLSRVPEERFSPKVHRGFDWEPRTPSAPRPWPSLAPLTG